MTKKTESAETMAEEGLAATCEGIVRDYLAHRGYEVHVADGWSCDGEDAPIVAHGRRRDDADSRHLRIRGRIDRDTRAQRGRRRVRDNEARVPALPRGPRRRGRNTPRRGLHRCDGRASGEAAPPHRRLAMSGERGVTWGVRPRKPLAAGTPGDGGEEVQSYPLLDRAHGRERDIRNREQLHESVGGILNRSPRRETRSSIGRTRPRPMDARDPSLPRRTPLCTGQRDCGVHGVPVDGQVPANAQGAWQASAGEPGPRLLNGWRPVSSFESPHICSGGTGI